MIEINPLDEPKSAKNESTDEVCDNKSKDKVPCSTLGYKGSNYEVNFKIPTTTSCIVCGTVGLAAGFGAGFYTCFKYFRQAASKVIL